MKKLLALSLLLSVTALGFPGHRASAQPASRRKVEPFPLRDVRVLPGPFRDAMDRNRDYMLRLDVDRFMHRFRVEAGLPSSSTAYGGWESMGVAGQTLGHYLSALSMYYSATGDRRFKERAETVVRALAEVQQAHGNGFVGAMPNGKKIFADVAAGRISSSGFDLNGGWVPWYNIHKTLAGLVDAYTLAGVTPARDVAARLADWANETTKNLTHEQWQAMLACEHGGMNDALANLYALTRNPRHLALARKFHHDAVLNPLARQQDRLAGLHANTQIPKVVGLARLYEIDGEPQDRTAAEFFWQRIVNTRSYVIGGNSDHEHLAGPNEMADRLSAATAETCNTYNVLKLTRHLFTWNPSARYADYYERALLNQILAQQEPRQGMFQYYQSLKPGHFKTYSTPFDAFWCCVGSGLENHTKYGESIYFHDANALYVNLFIASEVRWSGKQVRVRQETRFPDGDTARFIVTAARPARFALKVRYPSWSQGMTVSVNGTPRPVKEQPGGYVTLDRTWKTGDRVDVRVPMHLTTEAMPDNPRKVAVLYGPVVLAGQLGRDGLKPPMPYANDAGAYFNVATPEVPVILREGRPVSQWVRPVKGQPLTFRTVGAQPGEVPLRPYFRTYYDRYTVYWDTFSRPEWDARQAEYRAEQERFRALERRTLDFVRPGEQQSDVDHGLASQNSRAGSGEGGRRWRDAADGWFSYRMKAASDAPLDLIATYWGSDSGGRRFDILVDNVVIATETLNQDQPNRYFDRTYPIPADLVAGKDAVTVTFRAAPGATAGGVFGIRIVRH